jgi:hypothetical protein
VGSALDGQEFQLHDPDGHAPPVSPLEVPAKHCWFPLLHQPQYSSGRHVPHWTNELHAVHEQAPHDMPSLLQVCSPGLEPHVHS